MPPRLDNSPRPFSETHFGKLPYELRYAIYQWTLTMPTHDKPRLNSYVFLMHKCPGGYDEDGLMWYNLLRHEYRTRPERWLGLLQSCRQVHQEALGFFYKVNQIAFQRASSLIALSKTFPNRFRLLESIHIDLTDKHPLELVMALAQCTNLRHLSFHLTECKSTAVWLFQFYEPGVKAALASVRGLESVEFTERFGKEWHDRHVTSCQMYTCPKSWFNWNKKRIRVAEQIRETMMRPKPTPTEIENLEETSDTEWSGA
ncbi:MAG: hypothetical protein Q9219_003594 [cf. Caloplaca sp. 3 TL-2023]